MILNINKTKTTISFDHNWPLIDIKVTKVIIPTPEDGPLSSDMFTSHRLVYPQGKNW